LLPSLPIPSLPSFLSHLGLMFDLFLTQSLHLEPFYRSSNGVRSIFVQHFVPTFVPPVKSLFYYPHIPLKSFIKTSFLYKRNDLLLSSEKLIKFLLKH